MYCLHLQGERVSQQAGCRVQSTWLHGHTRLPGNEVTDAAAKEVAVFRNLTSNRALGREGGNDVCAFFFTVLFSYYDNMKGHLQWGENCKW
jgi:hypothetical protein